MCYFQSLQKPPRLAKKILDLQPQLNAAREDLKKVKEQLVSVEQEKAQALEELNEARKHANEATKKLSDALIALDKAEENTEIERFRAIELEQAGIDASQQREEIWEKELETIQNQHAIDVGSLLSTTEELQRLQKELLMTTEAKTTALSHTNDAMKIAEINAEKVEVLSGEITRLKALLHSKTETIDNEVFMKNQKSDVELSVLRCELEEAKETAGKLAELELLIEDLKTEVTDAKKAELDASTLVNEWKKKAELLELRVEEAILSERASSESLTSAVEQLDECNGKLQNSMSDIAFFKEKVGSLEIEITRCEKKLDVSERRIEISKREVTEMEKTIEELKLEIQRIEGEKTQAIDSEKQIVGSLQSLLQEKEGILMELESSRNEVEHSKRAMDGLASALHEVSIEARESKEGLLAKQIEVDNAKEQISKLNEILKSTEERYIAMINEAKDEIVGLESNYERSELEAENLRIIWNRKEQSFLSSIKKSDDEVNALNGQIDEMVNKLKETEQKVAGTKEENAHLLARINEAELEATTANKIVEDVKETSLKLKEVLLDKETELQSITQENEDLRTREEVATEKIKQLSMLLEEVTANKLEVNGKLENVNDLVAVSDLLNSNGRVYEEDKLKSDTVTSELDLCKEHENTNVDNGHDEEAEERNIEVDVKKLETCDYEGSFSSERMVEVESLVGDSKSKTEFESLFQINGLATLDETKNDNSPPSTDKQQKKKALLSKFGSFLKKKNSHK